MKTKILIGLLIVAAITAAVFAFTALTLEVNSHRPQLQAALSRELGRPVKLGGAIHIGLSPKGLTLGMKDVVFGNPEWASRPNMANIKNFEMKIRLLPMLQHRFDVDGLTIENADIQLETNAGGEHNWAMRPIDAKPEPQEKAAQEKVTYGGKPVVVNINNLSIEKTRVAVRGSDGKVTVVKVDDATLGAESGGLGLHFNGSLNNQIIALTATTNEDSLLSGASRPIDIKLNFANFHFTATGKLILGSKRAEFGNYEFTSGDTKLSGRLALEWGAARPFLQGTINSEKLIPADLSETNAPQESNSAPTPAQPAVRVFRNDPLPLGALKAADINFDVAIGMMPVGSVELQNIKSKLMIKGGHLFLSPLAMALGGGSIDGEINLDAGHSPAQFGTKLKIADVDLMDLIKIWGAEAFLSGKVNADVNLASHGDSMHEQAGNLSGTINLIGAGGDVIGATEDQLAAGLAAILSPGAGTAHGNMNCVVARFIALNGEIKSNGILVDTSAATMAGYGDIDLRSETLSLDFHAKDKLIKIGGLLPPLHIGGTLLNPEVSANAAAVVQNVGQLLTGGAMNDGVPDVFTQQGQNSCAYTLDHPSTVKAASPSQNGVVQDLAGKAGTLLKGLFGK